MNDMPKFVASRTLTPPLEWNARLLDGDIVDAIRALKRELSGSLISPSAGEFTRSLIRHDLVDEYWITISPYLWADDPRLFDGIGPVRLEPTGTTVYPFGLVRLSYRPDRSEPANRT